MPRGDLLRALLVAVLLRSGTPALASEARRTPVVVAVERVSPAVVNLATEKLVARRSEPESQEDRIFEEFFRDSAGPEFEERLERTSLGSGLLFDAAGHILTNAHVVQRASRLLVVLADGRPLEAEVVGIDPVSDLAVLRVRTDEKLPWASLGTSADLLVGETLLAIGNPFGLSHTVTVGVLSAKARTVRAGTKVYGDFLQTDASINPGNSGGPLVNLDGEVVGIATAVFASGRGIGFGIPIDRARRVAESLIRHGVVNPAWIGVETKAAGEALARSLRIASGQALVVTHVIEDGPAARSGVVPGDVIAAVAGEPVASPAALEGVLARLEATREVRLDVVRRGRSIRLTLRPVERGSPSLLSIAQAVLGVRLAERSGGEPGVVISAVIPGGRAASRGFAAGDVLYEIDGVKLSGLDSLRETFYLALGKRSVLLLVQHGEDAYYVPMVLE